MEKAREIQYLKKFEDRKRTDRILVGNYMAKKL